MGTFFKQIYRYSHPRAFRHNENLWPYVKITRSSTGEIVRLAYKKKSVPLVPLSALKNAYSGEVLLTATGPSVKDISFEVFPEMPALGVNGAYFLHNQVSFTLYLIVDMGFIDRRSDIIAEIVKNENLIFFTTVHGIARIIDCFSLEAIKCRLVAIEDIACKVYQPKIEDSELHNKNAHRDSIVFSENKIGFNKDIRSGIFDAGTVAYWAFQLLSFLGFKLIYLVGLDMNNFHQPRFYENEREKLPSFLSEKLDSIIRPSFRHASQVMKSENIKVVNLSLASAIEDEIFEKVNYNDIF